MHEFQWIELGKFAVVAFCFSACKFLIADTGQRYMVYNLHFIFSLDVP
jgi:hypothetical protein